MMELKNCIDTFFFFSFFFYFFSKLVFDIEIFVEGKTKWKKGRNNFSTKDSPIFSLSFSLTVALILNDTLF